MKEKAFYPPRIVWIIFSILISAAGIFAALPYFTAQEPQPEESILSLAEILREQTGEFEAIKKHKQVRMKKTPHDAESVDALSKREEEIKQTIQRTVAAYREKLHQEMKQFHELEIRIQQLSQNEAEQKIYRELIDALKQNQANLLFWLNRSVQEAPRCYCVPQDVHIFLSGR